MVKGACLKKSECDIENKQKWANKATQCNIRIEAYSNVLKRERAAATNFPSTNNDPNDDTSNLELEVLEVLNPKISERAIEKEDELATELDTDTTRRRLTILRSTIRQAIIKCHGKKITAMELNDISRLTSTRKEIQVCLFTGKLLNAVYSLEIELDAFVCYNEECVTVKAGKATHDRDALSSLAIGLSGLAMLLFGVTFPVFSSKASQFNTEQFNKAVAFPKRSATQPTADGE
ncbi:hypothetical protein INT48_009437 [Thamnidium elegans]|uniref:Uncharacterized protein n=1 Tax=Thamnidium elegans TaxID=101142 RepID=A0A8H7VYT5_9FUNG|nr:hypothetical protein INT48_009437 [Thamnidium elegans]